MQHQSVVRFYDCQLDEESNTYWLLMEYFPGTTLLQLLKDPQATLSEPQIRGIMLQLTEAVAYLHSLNICHRDLNLENVLVNKDLQIKVIDFGISKPLSPDNALMFSPVGNVNFRAPESRDFGGYSLSYDVWQLGLIFAQVVKRETISTKKAMKSPDFLVSDETLGKKGQVLLRGMLEADPKKRVRADDALKSEWLGAQL